MNNSYTLKQDIVDFLLKAKIVKQEWQSDAEIAKFLPYPIDEIQVQLLILAAEGTIELDDADKVIRVRLVKLLEPSKKRGKRIDPLEVAFDTMDLAKGLFNRVGCFIPLIGALMGAVFPIFVMEAPSLAYVFLAGATGLIVGGIISKELT